MRVEIGCVDRTKTLHWTLVFNVVKAFTLVAENAPLLPKAFSGGDWNEWLLRFDIYVRRRMKEK